MSKIYGLFGAMTGKVADVVMVVRNGVQVVRKYQPVVSNPSTPAQVASRARLKLMSQLGEVLADGIAFSRQGIVSARNRFVSANYALSTFNTEQSRADINLLQVNLTGGTLGMPALNVTRGTGVVSAALFEGVSYDAVMYVVIQRGADGLIRFVEARQVTDAGESGLYPSGDFSFSSSREGVVYAYGIRFNSDTARTRYGSLLTESTTGFLNVIRTASESDYTLTETIAAAITTAV